MLAFAILWIPLGQHVFLLEHWMKVGTFMAPFLAFAALAFKSRDTNWTDARILSLGLLVAYIVHQFEEHWIDIYGQTFAFKPYLNGFLSNLMGQQAGTELISDASIFVINTSLVWLVGALASWRGAQHIFAPLCMAAIVVTNGISHLGAAGLAGGYNPGLLTAVLVFLPLGIFAYIALSKSGAAWAGLVLASLLWGLLAHIIMIGGIVLMNRTDVANEVMFFAALIAWSITPAFAFSSDKVASFTSSSAG
ncbi:MAG: HXXEE domain-containing protein [Cohaesibacteraceae bacterium]